MKSLKNLHGMTMVISYLKFNLRKEFFLKVKFKKEKRILCFNRKKKIIISENKIEKRIVTHKKLDLYLMECGMPEYYKILLKKNNIENIIY